MGLQTKKKPTSKKIVKTIQKQTLINNFLLQENFCKTKTIRFLRKFSTNFSLPPSKNNVLSTFDDFFLNLKKEIICKNGFTLQFAAPPLAKKNLKIFSARVRLCKTKNRLEEKKNLKNERLNFEFAATFIEFANEVNYYKIVLRVSWPR